MIYLPVPSMDIYFYGLTAVRIRGKKTAVVIDPFSKEKTGKKFEKVETDAVLLTAKNSPMTSLDQIQNYRVVIDGPGEYEVGGVAIIGIGVSDSTVYALKMDGIVLLHLGKLDISLSDSQIDKLPAADIVFATVGNEMPDIIAKLEPKIIIPMYETGALGGFLKGIGKEGLKPQAKLTITREKLPGEMEVVVLE